jgi:glycosyltransferase involved in cell wall biosynthesis
MAIQYGIAPLDKVEVIHNGVEASETGTQKPSSDAAIKAMFVGRLARPKEPELLLAALAELPAPVRDAYELQIVGEGPLLPALRRMASMTSAKAQFLGPLAREEVLKKLAGSHVFVLTSRYEGLPVSILEAMSAGLAVIASDVGGVGEAVTAECGILVPSGDKEALKLALIRLAEDRAIIARYGTAASERARRAFSRSVMCEKTLAVYESIRAR